MVRDWELLLSGVNADNIVFCNVEDINDMQQYDCVIVDEADAVIRQALITFT
jgi:hypothetical protein